jgi:hypothetical protein
LRLCRLGGKAIKHFLRHIGGGRDFHGLLLMSAVVTKSEWLARVP